MGCYSTIVTNMMHIEFNYRETISVWFRQLFMFKPHADLMTNVPLQFKLHMLLGFTIFACWPFTRLVHVWSVPLSIQIEGTLFTEKINYSNSRVEIV